MISQHEILLSLIFLESFEPWPCVPMDVGFENFMDQISKRCKDLRPSNSKSIWFEALALPLHIIKKIPLALLFLGAPTQVNSM